MSCSTREEQLEEPPPSPRLAHSLPLTAPPAKSYPLLLPLPLPFVMTLPSALPLRPSPASARGRRPWRLAIARRRTLPCVELQPLAASHGPGSMSTRPGTSQLRSPAAAAAALISSSTTFGNLVFSPNTSSRRSTTAVAASSPGRASSTQLATDAHCSSYTASARCGAKNSPLASFTVNPMRSSTWSRRGPPGDDPSIQRPRSPVWNHPSASSAAAPRSPTMAPRIVFTRISPTSSPNARMASASEAPQPVPSQWPLARGSWMRTSTPGSGMPSRAMPPGTSAIPYPSDTTACPPPAPHSPKHSRRKASSAGGTSAPPTATKRSRGPPNRRTAASAAVRSASGVAFSTCFAIAPESSAS